jgi:hypothetical protein
MAEEFKATTIAEVMLKQQVDEVHRDLSYAHTAMRNALESLYESNADEAVEYLEQIVGRLKVPAAEPSSDEEPAVPIDPKDETLVGWLFGVSDESAAAQLGLDDDYKIVMASTEVDYFPDLDSVNQAFDSGLATAAEVVQEVMEHTVSIELPRGFLLVGMTKGGEEGSMKFGIVRV